MASPEKIAPLLPDTLPDDFGEWDNEGSPKKDGPAYGWDNQPTPTTATVYSWESQAPVTAAESIRSNEWEEWEAAHASKVARSAVQPVERRPVLSPVVDRPSVSDSAASTHDAAERQLGVVDRESEASPSAKQDDADEWAVWAAAHSSRKGPKSYAKSLEPKAALSPVAEKPRAAEAASPAPAIAKPQQEPAKESADASLARPANKAEASQAAHALTAAPNRPNFAVADEALYQMFSTATFEEKGERKDAGKKRITIIAASAGAVVVLVILMIAMFHHGSQPAMKQSVQTLPVAAEAQPQTEIQKPNPGEPLQGNAPAGAAAQPATDGQSTNDDNQADSTTAPTQTQTQMMNEQLAAPTRIQRDANKQIAENEPSGSGFGIAGVDGMGNSAANGVIFNGHTQSVVKAQPPKPVAISSGVATGMLISKMPPVYPPIAKTARVSGTVELQATISKIGTITDLHVVHGPAMLRQAAVDAVKTWRYRPYKLNNEPTEVQTTINVVFSLGD